MMLSQLLFAVAAAAHDCINHIAMQHANPRSDAQPYAYLRDVGKRAANELATAPLRVHFDTFYLNGGSMHECTAVGQHKRIMDVDYVCEASNILTQEGKNKIVRVLDRLKREIADILRI